MKRPLLQIVRRSHVLPHGFGIDHSRTVGSTLLCLRTPLFGLNFYRPRRVAFWRWVRPRVVVCR